MWLLVKQGQDGIAEQSIAVVQREYLAGTMGTEQGDAGKSPGEGQKVVVRNNFV